MILFFTIRRHEYVLIDFQLVLQSRCGIILINITKDYQRESRVVIRNAFE